MIGDLGFAEPLFRWLAAGTVVVLVVLFALDFTRRQRQLEGAGHVPMLERMMASFSRERRIIKAVLLTAGAALVVAALSRPQVPGESKWRQRGIDVVVVLDFSKSMLARDVRPSRFRRAVEEVDRLLDVLRGDRVALVAFAGAAAHFPLTADVDAVRQLYVGLTPLDMPPGSDIGHAMVMARCLARPELRNEPGCERVGGRGRGGAELDDGGDDALPPTDTSIDRAKAIVLFTDGEDTEGALRAEVERAVELGIAVYIVGVGTPSGELIPEYDQAGNEVGWKKREDDSFVTTRLEEGTLVELARLAGGEDHYYRLDRRSQVAELVTALDKLKKGDLDDRVVRTPVEAYHWLLFPAFMLLLIEVCVSERRRIRA